MWPQRRARWRRTAASGAAATERDLVSDFKQAEGDKIDLQLVDATPLTPSNDSFIFIGAGPFTHVAGQLRYEAFDLAGTADDYTLVSADVQGDGLAEMAIKVKGLVFFVALDFLL